MPQMKPLLWLIMLLCSLLYFILLLSTFYFIPAPLLSLSPFYFSKKIYHWTWKW